MANSVDSDQTAPIGAVCSGSTLFASILNLSVMLGNYLQQTTPADDIFRCIFLLGALRVKSLLRQGLLEPEFYSDLVYKLKKRVGHNKFSTQFIKIISHYKKIGYNVNIYILQQTACLVVNPITVNIFAFLFNCTPVGRTSDSMTVPT